MMFCLNKLLCMLLSLVKAERRKSHRSLLLMSKGLITFLEFLPPPTHELMMKDVLHFSRNNSSEAHSTIVVISCRTRLIGVRVVVRSRRASSWHARSHQQKFLRHNVMILLVSSSFTVSVHNYGVQCTDRSACFAHLGDYFLRSSAQHRDRNNRMRV